MYHGGSSRQEKGLARETAHQCCSREDVPSRCSWQPVIQEGRLLQESWTLQDRYHLAWWDARVVAAAVRAQCRYLLSEDFQDGMVFGDVTVIVPFERDYESPLR